MQPSADSAVQTNNSNVSVQNLQTPPAGNPGAQVGTANAAPTAVTPSPLNEQQDKKELMLEAKQAVIAQVPDGATAVVVNAPPVSTVLPIAPEKLNEDSRD